MIYAQQKYADVIRLSIVSNTVGISVERPLAAHVTIAISLVPSAEADRPESKVVSDASGAPDHYDSPCCASAAIGDHMIDEIATLALQRLSMRILQQAVREIVPRTAERLIDEELERIRSARS